MSASEDGQLTSLPREPAVCLVLMRGLVEPRWSANPFWIGFIFLSSADIYRGPVRSFQANAAAGLITCFWAFSDRFALVCLKTMSANFNVERILAWNC